MVVIHGAVGIIPALVNFRPILGAVLGSVALLRATKINQHFVVFINHYFRICLFTIHKNVAPIEALSEESWGFVRERFFKGGK